VISASRLAMAAAVVLAIGTLVALPDLMRGAGGGPVVEVSTPFDDAGAGDRSGSGGDTSSPKRVPGRGPSGGGQPKSSVDRPSGDDSTGSDTGSPASAEQSPGASSSGAAGDAYIGGHSGGGRGGGGESVDDQPVEVNPLPTQPAAPPTAYDAGGVDDIVEPGAEVAEAEPEVTEPEAEVAG
jgi:hypothetical protein